MGKPELLAPASFLTLKTAVASGADAVYLGGNAFGARSYAENFDNEKLRWAIDYCHLRGVKVYLTLNTLVTDKELPEAMKLAEFAAREGIDAFILQDLGLASKIKSLGVPLHASTQLTVHSTEGVLLMKKLGFKRVVLSREMTKEEIKKVTAKSGLETEIFVHGALCMCYSGQCLMSSIIGGRSGNRGKCAQPCRLPYTLLKDGKEDKKGYFLSPKDLSLAKNIDDIFETGATSLKIEGRMKGKEYVAAAVSIFAKALAERKNATKEDMSLLENSFSRGGSFTKGKFSGDSDILLTEKGNDDVYEIRSTEVLQKLEELCDEKTNFRKFPAAVRLTAIKGEPLRAEMLCRGVLASFTGNVVGEAKNKPIDRDTVLRQISKTGETTVFVEDLVFETDGKAFLALSEINEIRRRLTGEIESKITDGYKRDVTCPQPEARRYTKNKDFLGVSVMTKEQLKAAENGKFRYIFAGFELEAEGENIITLFPDIIKEENFGYYTDIIEKRKLTRICSGNLGLIFWALKRGIKAWATAAVNIYNSEAAAVWAELGLEGACISPELNLKDIKAITSEMELSVTAYGYLPLMKTANCPIKSAYGKCLCGAAEFSFKDRKNEIFSIKTDTKQCVNTIYNSKPLFMGDKQDDLKNMGKLISFVSEDKITCETVLKMYEKKQKYDGDYTRGHFYRGAL